MRRRQGYPPEFERLGFPDDLLKGMSAKNKKDDSPPKRSQSPNISIPQISPPHVNLNSTSVQMNTRITPVISTSIIESSNGSRSFRGSGSGTADPDRRFK